jgi:hypothetical protein
MKRHVLLLLLLACNSTAELPGELAQACPGPTVPRGGVCKLMADARLTETLVIPSNTHVDCGDYALMPGPGVQLAVLIHDAEDAMLTSCHIEGFDFGVFVVRSTSHVVVSQNVVDVVVKGISLFATQDVTVEENVVKYTSGQGLGIGVWRGSHGNVVRKNQIEGAVASADDMDPDYPAPDIQGRYAPSPGAVFSGTGIYVANGSLSLSQFIAAGILFQFPNGLAGVEDTIVEDNDIVLGSAAGPAGITMANAARRVTVTSNRVTARGTTNAEGITAFPGNYKNQRLPATCSLLPTRYCHLDADCDLLAAPGANGVCASTTGVCSTAATACSGDQDCAPGICWRGSIKMMDLRSLGQVVEANDLQPGLTTGITDNGTLTPRIAGNRVNGATVAAIALDAAAIVGATVEDNILTANRVGLSLLSAPAATPGLIFRENDVTGSTVRPLAAPADWKVMKLLTGNYWGRPCPDAFRRLPENVPLFCTGDATATCDEDADCPSGKGVCGTADAEAPNAFLVDDRPYGQPVAGAATLPSACN